MDEPNYWTRWDKRRLSRRRLLTGAAGAGAGLAALSVVGCGGGGEGGPSPSPGASRVASPVASPAGSPAASATTGVPGNVYHRWGVGPPPPLEPAKTKGGVDCWFGFEPMPLDTFDPHQTQFGPTAGPHSAIFSKVLNYWDAYQGVMEPDLAEAVPEAPDKLTYVVESVPAFASTARRRCASSFPRWPAVSSLPRT